MYGVHVNDDAAPSEASVALRKAGKRTVLIKEGMLSSSMKAQGQEGLRTTGNEVWSCSRCPAPPPDQKVVCKTIANSGVDAHTRGTWESTPSTMLLERSLHARQMGNVGPAKERTSAVQTLNCSART